MISSFAAASYVTILNRTEECPMQRQLLISLLCSLLAAFTVSACGDHGNTKPVEPPPDQKQPVPDPPDKKDEEKDKEKEKEENDNDEFIEDLPSDDDLDMSYLTPVPCDATAPDALCYNKDAFVAAHPERIEAYRTWQYNIYTEGEEMNDVKENALQEALDKVVESIHELLASCNYYRDDQDQVRVKCPDELMGLFACPHMWFHPEMFVLGGIRFHEDEDPICYEELVPEPGGFCNVMSCSDGKVCSGPFSLLLDPNEDDEEDDLNDYFSALPICVSRERCLQLRESQNLSWSDSCYFSDRTVLTSEPSIPAFDDCDSLEDGLCAINCPCADPEARCTFISQEHPVGMCSTTRCQANQDCNGEEVCVQDGYYRQFKAAHWLLEDLYGHANATFDDCVQPNACEAWLDHHPRANFPMAVVHCDGND